METEQRKQQEMVSVGVSGQKMVAESDAKGIRRVTVEFQIHLGSAAPKDMPGRKVTLRFERAADDPLVFRCLPPEEGRAGTGRALAAGRLIGELETASACIDQAAEQLRQWVGFRMEM